MGQANPLEGSDSSMVSTIDIAGPLDVLASGAVIAGRYELKRLLGAGGMGEVWSAINVVTEKSVALKFLKGPANLDRIRRLVREARAASAVRHPNVVAVHDILTLDTGVPALVMDLLEGESLAEKLRRSNRLSLHELASIMVPVISAVGAAHAAGIVHRDLKPDNIFLAELGDGRVEPKVLDFGICKLFASAGLTMASTSDTATGTVMGTPRYMAPEQVFGENDVDARADVWALGVILYECSTGQKPVDGENIGQMIKLITAGTITPIEQLVPDLPPRYSNLVNRMLARDRHQRPSDLREPFATLRDLTGLTAQSFDRALDSPSPSPPSVRTPSGARFDNSGPLIKSSGERTRGRSIVARAAILGMLALGVFGLTGAARSQSNRNRAIPLQVGQSFSPAAAPTPSPPPLAAPAPLSSIAQDVPVASGAVQPAQRSLRSSSRVRRGGASAYSKAKRESHSLAGGIHGSVPF